MSRLHHAMRAFRRPGRFLSGLASALLVVVLLPFCAAAETAQPPSDEECTEFGRKLADAFDEGRAGEVVQMLDKFALADRISAGLGFNAEEERDFRAGLLENLAKGLAQQFGTFNSGHFVRLQHVGGETRALVRIVAESGATNYIAFVCHRRGNAPLRWADAFLYLSGEKISESGRRTALPFVAQAKKGLLERLATGESDFVRNIKTIQNVNQLLQKGDAAGAWAECEKLPPSVKNDRTMLLLRLRAAQEIDEQKYLAVIHEWEKAFPNDATLDLVSIDGDVMRKDYAGALKHVDSFAKQIGGDAYLDFLAANVLFMAGRYDESKARARKAVATEPTLGPAYDSLLAIAVKMKNHAETVAVLDQLQQAFPQANVESLIADEKSYEEFRASDEYRAWSQKRKAAAPKKE